MENITINAGFFTGLFLGFFGSICADSIYKIIRDGFRWRAYCKQVLADQLKANVPLNSMTKEETEKAVGMANNPRSPFSV